MSLWMRGLLNLASPAGPRGSLSILIFHRVHARTDPIFPGEADAASFDAMLGWVREAFQVLPLEEASARLRDGSLPARALTITFDDGYADNHDVAMPILQRHGLSACFFISTGMLSGGRMFNDTVVESLRLARAERLDVRGLGLGELTELDLGAGDDWTKRRHAIEAVLRSIKYLPHAERLVAAERLAERSGATLPTDLMMTPEQVRAMRRGGMEVGGHTRTHPILAQLDEAAAWAEIAGGRDDIQQILGEPVPLFAYPNGKPVEDYSAESVRLVGKSGYTTAVSTAWGAARPGRDPLQLPRFTPWDRSAKRFQLRLLRQLRGPEAAQV